MANVSEKSKKVMGIGGLSEYLDVPKSTIYKLAQEGKLPGQKVGKQWRFRQETINKWLDGGGQLDNGKSSEGSTNDE